MANLERFTILAVRNIPASPTIWLRIDVVGTEYPIDIPKIVPSWRNLWSRDKKYKVGDTLVCRTTRNDRGIITKVEAVC